MTGNSSYCSQFSVVFAVAAVNSVKFLLISYVTGDAFWWAYFYMGLQY